MSDIIHEAFDAWIASVDKRRGANGWEPLTARDVNMLREGYMKAALAQKPAPVAQEPVACCPFCGESAGRHDHAFPHPRAIAEQPDAWTPSGADYDRNIHRNPDAAAWADLFVATFPGLADKHDLMLGWFANAMMAMHDFLKAEQPDAVAVPRELLETLLQEQISALGYTNTTARKTQFLLAGGAE